jgi:hypothetical protein
MLTYMTALWLAGGTLRAKTANLKLGTTFVIVSSFLFHIFIAATLPVPATDESLLLNLLCHHL